MFAKGREIHSVVAEKLAELVMLLGNSCHRTGATDSCHRTGAS